MKCTFSKDDMLDVYHKGKIKCCSKDCPMMKVCCDECELVATCTLCDLHEFRGTCDKCQCCK